MDSEYIINDQGQHELWEEIQKMSQDEREEYIKKFESEKQQ